MGVLHRLPQIYWNKLRRMDTTQASLPQHVLVPSSQCFIRLALLIIKKDWRTFGFSTLLVFRPKIKAVIFAFI